MVLVAACFTLSQFSHSDWSFLSISLLLPSASFFSRPSHLMDRRFRGEFESRLGFTAPSSLSSRSLFCVKKDVRCCTGAAASVLKIFARNCIDEMRTYFSSCVASRSSARGHSFIISSCSSSPENADDNIRSRTIFFSASFRAFVRRLVRVVRISICDTLYVMQRPLTDSKMLSRPARGSWVALCISVWLIYYGRRRGGIAC